MRILFLSHRLPYPPNKGDKIRSFWELKTLSRRHEIDLFCFYDDEADRKEVANIHRYCRSCYVEPLSGLRSRGRAAVGLIRREPFSTAYFRSRSMTRQIADSFKARTHDLMFVFGSAMAPYAEQHPHVPKVLDMVDVDSDKWEQYAVQGRPPLSWLWKLESRRLGEYESRLVRSFANTLISTEAECRLLRSKCATGKITVLQNSLDTAYFSPQESNSFPQIQSLKPYVIFTGTMDYPPNVQAVEFFCSEILPHVVARVPRIKFVIAGRNPSKRVLDLAANSSVRITGAVPDIRPYLQNAAVAVAPMKIARGVQNKILEALAMGLPVVATPLTAGALPRELAFHVEEESDPRQFGERVVKHLIGPAQREDIQRAAVKRFFDELRLSEQLEECVSAAAGRIPSSRERSDMSEVQLSY